MSSASLRSAGAARQDLKDPVQVRAFRLVDQLLHRAGQANTPEGRYAINRLRTRAKHAEERAPKVAKKRAQRKAKGGKTFSDLMHLADRVFSLFIRWRDTRDTAFGRVGRCATCKQVHPFQELQNGHWIRREHWGTRWDEHNCNAQNVLCNNYRGGEEEKHGAYIEKKWGKGTCDRLRVLAKVNEKKPNEWKVRGIILHYAVRLKEMGYTGDLSEFFALDAEASATEGSRPQ